LVVNDNQSFSRNFITLTTLVEVHAKNMPAEFHKICPSGIEGKVI
jgi:hypothetical protein